jgi:soluble lytic murein transglycosylase-like protein
LRTWWNSCAAGGTERTRPGTRTTRLSAALLPGALLALGLLATLPASAASQERDPALRQRLQAALAEPVSFADRYEAEVWLTDMAGRLARKVPDPDERIEILEAVHREATRAQLPPEMVLAVIDVESGFQRYAVSRANAQGLMQIMRFWLKELGMPGHALLDIQDNIRMGCTILRYYYDMENGNWNRALARYNGSLGSQKYPNLVFDRLQSRWYQQ